MEPLGERIRIKAVPKHKTSLVLTNKKEDLSQYDLMCDAVSEDIKDCRIKIGDKIILTGHAYIQCIETKEEDTILGIVNYKDICGYKR